MNRSPQVIIGSIGVIVILIGSLALGAITAPQKSKPVNTPVATQSTKPTVTPAKEKVVTLDDELPTITQALIAAYPKISTEYSTARGELYEKGKWYGTTLTYKGSDTMNRDTLRVLMQKKDGEWIIRTTPPEPLLSAKKYTDVPIGVLKAINEPVSLPGVD